MMTLQDLHLEILLEIAKLHPWVGCELAKTVRKVGIYSLENDMKRYYKVEENNETFILVKFPKEPYHRKLCHSWDDVPATFLYKYPQWYKLGRLHREADLPAAIECDGTQYWCKDGKFHRDNDKPAVIYSNGKQEWYKEGKRYYLEWRNIFTS